MLTQSSACILVILTVLSATNTIAQKAPQKPGFLDAALQQADKPGRRQRVIVRHRSGAAAAANVRARLAGKGVQGTRELTAASSLSAEWTGPTSALNSLKADPDVLGVSVDAIVTAGGAQSSYSGVSTSPVVGAQSDNAASGGLLSTLGLTTTYDAQGLRSTLGLVSADAVRGVGIAIIDSGIYPSADLAGRISAFYDFTAGGVAAQPSDAFGHGTHIAGLIAGNGKLSNGKYVGVATDARLIGLKVLNGEGVGYTSDVIAAIDFAITSRKALGIDVINLSLGHPSFEPAATDPLVQAVERAVASGIVVVVSAGNHGLDRNGKLGYAGITSPGNAPSAITVGAQRTKATATRRDDEVSSFSSRGPTWYDAQIKPDVIAPGQALVAVSHPGATLFADKALRADVYPYIKLSGTSMASAVASGVVALIIDTNRRDEGLAKPLTPNMVKGILQFTAIPVRDPDASTPLAFEQGTGAINAAGAKALAKAVEPATPIGGWWLEGGITPFSSIAGVSLPWSQHIVWGDYVVGGETLAKNRGAWRQNVVWGNADHIVWGDSFFKSLNLVVDSFSAWSDHIVWGDRAVRGNAEHIVWGDLDADHIVWGDGEDHIVWGDGDEHIVWGDAEDHIVWGDTVSNVGGGIGAILGLGR